MLWLKAACFILVEHSLSSWRWFQGNQLMWMLQGSRDLETVRVKRQRRVNDFPLSLEDLWVTGVHPGEHQHSLQHGHDHDEQWNTFLVQGTHMKSKRFSMVGYLPSSYGSTIQSFNEFNECWSRYVCFEERGIWKDSLCWSERRRLLWFLLWKFRLSFRKALC